METSPYVINQVKNLIKEFSCFAGDPDLSREITIKSVLKHLEILTRTVPGDKELISRMVNYIHEEYHY